MTYEEIIARAEHSPDLQQNILTDGLRTCCYNDLPRLFKSIDRLFSENNIDIENCFALECANSVPGALTLLYLLKKGCGFVLLPPSYDKREARRFNADVPNFCQYRIIIGDPLKTPAADWENHPEDFLHIEKNGRYKQSSALNVQKLFLRTSGSMGDSKLAIHDHAKLLGSAFSSVEKYKLKPGDRIAAPVPIFHGYGLSTALLPAVVAGASLDLQDDVNILKYMERERAFNPNVAVLTPGLCRMLLEFRRTPRPYRLIITSGEKIGEDLFRAFDSRFNCLVNQYGSTELGPISACNPDDPPDVRAATVGTPMSGVEVRVSGSGIGELCCKHPYGFEGYADENGDRIREHNASDWFQTGDMAKIQADGNIRIFGRCDNSINRSGFLVLFSDIESAMEKLENIERAVVIASGGQGDRGQKITAFCVPQKDVADADQIRGLCSDILPKYAIPDDIVVIESLPLLPSGKTDRQSLLKLRIEN